jgi:hypothetical protein
LYANGNAFDVPESVVTVTGTVAGPAGGDGTVTEHDVVAEHVVGATWPPKSTTTWPLPLKRLAPETTTV